jgi:hypothetical protein
MWRLRVTIWEEVEVSDVRIIIGPFTSKGCGALGKVEETGFVLYTSSLPFFFISLPPTPTKITTMTTAFDPKNMIVCPPHTPVTSTDTSYSSGTSVPPVL